MGAPTVLVAGETLVDWFPEQERPLAAVESFTRRAGGAAANVAVGLQRLDATPWFWTRVGDDPFGEFLLQTLREEGLSERFLETDPDAKTSLAFVSDPPDGERSFSFYRDGTADTRMQSGTVPDDALDAIEYCYVGGVPFASDPSRTALFDLVERANRRGCTVVLDPNARPELWDEFDYAETLRELLAAVDVVKVSSPDVDRAGLGADDPLTAAEQVLEHGPHTVLLTADEEGAVAVSSERAPWGKHRLSHGGFQVDAVDATGAGDAFCAGMLACLAGGEPTLADVLAHANAVAALSVTGNGAMPSLPTAARVESFLAERSESVEASFVDGDP